MSLVYELPHELLSEFSFGKLENSQIWVETFPSAQSPFHKLNFNDSRQKLHKRSYQRFLTLHNFTGFLYLDPNILSGIIVTWPSFFNTVEWAFISKCITIRTAGLWKNYHSHNDHALSWSTSFSQFLNFSPETLPAKSQQLRH